MPRYFFHRVDGTSDLDHEGLELSGLEEARCEAVAFASDTLRSDRYEMWEGGEIRIETTNDAGAILFVVILIARLV